MRARVKIMLVGCPQTAGRYPPNEVSREAGAMRGASRSGAGLTIGRRGDSKKPKHAPLRTRHHLQTCKALGELGEAGVARASSRERGVFAAVRGDPVKRRIEIADELGIDAEEALSHATAKFTKRFSDTEDLVSADGKNMPDLPIEQLDVYWNQAKQNGNQ